MTAVNKKYGNIFHPQNHTPLPSTSRLAPAPPHNNHATVPSPSCPAPTPPNPPDNNHATLEEEGSKGDANSDKPAALEDEGSKEDANKSETTKRTCEDDPPDLNVATQHDEGRNATFPAITLDGFCSKFKTKMESEDSKPAKKRAKGGICTMFHTILII